MMRIMHCGRLAALSLALTAQTAIAQDQESTLDYPRISFGGTVEVEALHTSPYSGSDESDVVLATGALGLTAAINEWVSAEISTLYEENDTPLEIDTASVMFGNPEGLWSLHAGQFYVPFGVYETAMVSDPLTLELGETRETAIAAGVHQGGLHADIYAFNGDLESENRIDSFGATAGYAGKVGVADLALSAGYINSLGESDGLEETVNAANAGNDASEVNAWTASAVVGIGDLMLVGEYLAAGDAFDAAEIAYKGSGARPGAWNVEASYVFDLMGKPASAGIGYQGTEQAVALGLPESRAIAALSVEIFPRTALSLEYAHDEDYGIADGGSGESADIFTTQLAVTF
ncbi:MAG: LbtU family siderophore porin [Pseudomonadota bacterium]